MLDGLFTTPVYSRRRSRFVNLAFPDKKICSKIEVYLWQRNLKANVRKNSTFQVNRKKKSYRETTSYLEQPSRHFCQHFMRRTTQQTGLAINLASQQKTAKLYYSSQLRKQFKLLTVPFKPLHYTVVCEVKNLWIAMFENSAKIYFQTLAWFDPS